jgi:hypothetical protein
MFQLEMFAESIGCVRCPGTRFKARNCISDPVPRSLILKQWNGELAGHGGMNHDVTLQEWRGDQKPSHRKPTPKPSTPIGGFGNQNVPSGAAIIRIQCRLFELMSSYVARGQHMQSLMCFVCNQRTRSRLFSTTAWSSIFKWRIFPK